MKHKEKLTGALASAKSRVQQAAEPVAKHAKRIAKGVKERIGGLELPVSEHREWIMDENNKPTGSRMVEKLVLDRRHAIMAGTLVAGLGLVGAAGYKTQERTQAMTNYRAEAHELQFYSFNVMQEELKAMVAGYEPQGYAADMDVAAAGGKLLFRTPAQGWELHMSVRETDGSEHEIQKGQQVTLTQDLLESNAGKRLAIEIVGEGSTVTTGRLLIYPKK